MSDRLVLRILMIVALAFLAVGAGLQWYAASLIP